MIGLICPDLALFGVGGVRGRGILAPNAGGQISVCWEQEPTTLTHMLLGFMRLSESVPLTSHCKGRGGPPPPPSAPPLSSPLTFRSDD